MTNMKPTYTRAEVVALLERAAQMADEYAAERRDDLHGWRQAQAATALEMAAAIRRMAEELPE